MHANALTALVVASAVAVLATPAPPAEDLDLHRYGKRDAELEALTNILGDATYTEATTFEKCSQTASWYAQCKGTGEQLVPCLCADETAVTGINSCLTSTMGENRASGLIAKFATSCSELRNAPPPQTTQAPPGDSATSLAVASSIFGLGLLVGCAAL